MVLAQVNVGSFVAIARDGDTVKGLRGRFDKKSVDFLVCRKDLSIVAAIELDDSTHERKDRVHADKVKDKVLHDAGVVLLRWNVKSIPNGDAIRAAFAPMTASGSESGAKKQRSLAPAVAVAPSDSQRAPAD